jgi:hypothetical protein
MDWLEQTQKMVKSWTETQTTMWDRWFDTLKSTGQPSAADAWAKTLDTWQQSVGDTLKAQSDLTKMCVDNLRKVPGSGEWIGEMAKQAEEMMQQMNSTQQKLWDDWFAALKKGDPSKASGVWEQEGQKILEAWQQSMRDAIDAHMERASGWIESLEKEPGSKPTGPKK